jgi:flagellin-like protein
MKKGISPLIATILLIVVAVALISIILSWGSDFVTKNTSQADDVIDKDCVGAYINFVSCNYNTDQNKITATIVNTGTLNFRETSSFNVNLVDSEKEVDFSNTNVLDSNSLKTGESASFIIEDYNGSRPIDLVLRNTDCPLNSWQIKCS